MTRFLPLSRTITLAQKSHAQDNAGNGLAVLDEAPRARRWVRPIESDFGIRSGRFSEEDRDSAHVTSTPFRVSCLETISDTGHTGVYSSRHSTAKYSLARSEDRDLRLTVYKSDQTSCGNVKPTVE
jgi:hypothetical protein